VGRGASTRDGEEVLMIPGGIVGLILIIILLIIIF
jgi:hypothetical protein